MTLQKKIKNTIRTLCVALSFIPWNVPRQIRMTDERVAADEACVCEHISPNLIS